jgi:hypothetical protein
MPTITTTPISAWAHCPDVDCPGSVQRPVAGVHELVAMTCGDRGGGEPFTAVLENSTLYVRFADPDEIACPEDGCTRDREITDQERPNHGMAFGGPEALLRLRQIGAPNASRDSVLAAAQDVKSRPALAREQLDEAYVLGKIDEGEYQRKRAVLEGIAPPSAQPRARKATAD